jgi:hypothetical protein
MKHLEPCFGLRRYMKSGNIRNRCGLANRIEVVLLLSAVAFVVLCAVRACTSYLI